MTLHPIDPPRVDDEVREACDRLGVTILTDRDIGWPAPLRAAPRPPRVLYVRGDVLALRRCAVAIVGTRNASVAGTTVAASVAREMSARGRVVVSGLARGIDRAAHAGAVQRVYMGPPAAPTVTR